MKAFRLGDIETFPFVNRPPPAAIQGGYALLQELGALDEPAILTPLGQDLARLPIDPDARPHAAAIAAANTPRANC